MTSKGIKLKRRQYKRFQLCWLADVSTLTESGFNILSHAARCASNSSLGCYIDLTMADVNEIEMTKFLRQNVRSPRLNHA